MIRVRARYQNQKLELEQALNLAEGTEVEIEVRLPGEDPEKTFWSELGMSRLEEEWNNPEDAVYDDWKKLYGIQSG